jgi:hypothetical protein
MNKGEYYREAQHRAKLLAKYERLQGLRDLYATYEQAGCEPYPGSDMAKLRTKITSVRAQLKVMAGACDASAPLP